MDIKKLIKSFGYAFNGIKETIKNEQNIKVHLLIMCFVIVAGIIFKITKFEWIMCIILFGLVISAELFNTSIENTVDLITETKNEKARIAKDAAAGAVLIIAIASAIIGLIIFVPRIIDFLVFLNIV